MPILDFTNEAIGWFGTMDEMVRDVELMARRIREAHAAGYRSVGINVRVLDLVQPGAAELARLTGYDGRDHGCCLSVYDNALGGRVAVSSCVPWRRLGSLGKRSQLVALADWLAYGRAPVRLDAFRRVAPFVRMSADGGRYAVTRLRYVRR
jgi:hypothetical protein